MSDADGSTNALVPVEVQGWSLVKAGETDERLIDHREIAARLGYEDPRMFKKLVERYRDSGDLGHIHTVTVTVWREQGGGNPAEVHYLTEFQALFCIGKSETKIANDIYRQVIGVFLAVRRGQIQVERTKLQLESDLGKILIGQSEPARPEAIPERVWKRLRPMKKLALHALGSGISKAQVRQAFDLGEYGLYWSVYRASLKELKRLKGAQVKALRRGSVPGWIDRQYEAMEDFLGTAYNAYVL